MPATSGSVANHYYGVIDMQSVRNSQRSANWNSSGKPSKAAELRKRIDDSLETLSKAIDGVRASQDFQRFLEVQARFHHYSWHNTLLIASQRPDATRVAGYQAWKKLKRQVRKGERGIAIIAPCHYKREVKTDDGESETLGGLFFRVVHVFDVAQTDGEALPTVEVPTIGAQADALLAKLVTVAQHRSVKVDFSELRAGLFGVSKHGTVEVSNQHASGQQAGCR